MIVQLNDVSKSFGSQPILRDVSFQINPAEKIGLIGANGAGKTTLLKIIGRNAEVDTGAVIRRSNLQIGTLDQIPDFHEGTSVIEEGLRAFESLRSMEREMTDLEHSIADHHDKTAMERYSFLQHEFELKVDMPIRRALKPPCWGQPRMHIKPSRSLSGGERIVRTAFLLSTRNIFRRTDRSSRYRSIEWRNFS